MKEFLEYLFDNGMSFDIADIHNNMPHSLNVAQVLEFHEDPKAFMEKFEASFFGISVERYKKITNIKQIGIKRCSALTSNKKRCNNNPLWRQIRDTNWCRHETGELVVINDYLEFSGLLCEYHNKRIDSGHNVDILPIYWYESSQYD